MVNANFDGGASASVTTSFQGWGGVDSTGAYGVDLPTGGTLAFNGNRPVYVTTARFFVAGKGGSRSVRAGIGGQYSGYVTVASGSAAVAKDFTMNKVWQNGGSNLTTRLDGVNNDAFYFGRGADGTGSSIDDNGNTWSGSLSGYATYFYVPNAPTSLSATQSGTSQNVNLAWTAPTDTQGGITGYRIHYSTSSSFAGYVSIDTGSSTASYTVTGLTYGQTYYFRVMAINATATAASTSSVASTSASMTLITPGTDGWLSVSAPTGVTRTFNREVNTNVPAEGAGLHVKDVATATGGAYTSGGFRIYRDITGLEIGRQYTLSAQAILGTTSPVNIISLGIQGISSGTATTLTSTTTLTTLTPITFTATATTHQIAVYVRENYTITATGTTMEYWIFNLELTRLATDLTSTKGYWIQDNLVSGSLADHYQLTMDSIGGYWWVDKTGKTQFTQDLNYITPVGTFTDGYELVGGNLTPGQSLPGELHYNDIQVGYDTTQVVNDITITNEGLSPNEGNDTEPNAWQANWNQKNETSKTNWGTRKAELNTNLWLDSLDNIVTNPSFEVDLSTVRNVSGTTNSATKRVTTTAPPTGKGRWLQQHMIKTGITTETTLDIYVGDSTTGQGGDYDGITAGASYSAKAYVRKATNTANLRAAVQIRFYDEQNNVLALGTTAYVTLSTTNTWYEVTQTFTAPTGAVSALVRILVNKTDGSAIAAGAKVQWDGISLVQSGTPIYFDGNFNDTTSYIYDWLGNKSESMSRRSVNRLYTRATDILAQFDDPAVVAKEFTWNAAENPIVAGKIDVGSLLYLKFNGVNALYRVAGLSHDVSPNEWLITVQVQKAS